MSGTVMILCGTPTGEPTPYDGQYLKDMDFEAHGGTGLLTTTADPADAKTFASMAEALSFYMANPKCKPLRADGQPNRPLTATNWEFRNV